MITKCFEIRDRMTFIPVCATNTAAANEGQRYLLRRAGYAPDGHTVVLANLNDCRASCDPHSWWGRTMSVAHLYIEKHFADLDDGAVIDVEHILGETDASKISEASPPVFARKLVAVMRSGLTQEPTIAAETADAYREEGLTSDEIVNSLMDELNPDIDARRQILGEIATFGGADAYMEALTESWGSRRLTQAELDSAEPRVLASGETVHDLQRADGSVTTIYNLR